MVESSLLTIKSKRCEGFEFQTQKVPSSTPTYISGESPTGGYACMTHYFAKKSKRKTFSIDNFNISQYCQIITKLSYRFMRSGSAVLVVTLSVTSYTNENVQNIRFMLTQAVSGKVLFIQVIYVTQKYTK